MAVLQSITKFTIIFGILTIATSCNLDQNNSGVKGLDQITGRDIHATNSCEDKNASFKATDLLLQRIEGHSEMKDSILKSLSSVPPHLASFYFNVGGRIISDNDQFESCLSELSNTAHQFASGYGSSRRASSCWKKAGPENYTLYVPEDGDLIEHGLVRGFAMLLINSIAPYAEDNGYGLRSDRKVIADAFSKDLAILASSEDSSDMQTARKRIEQLKADEYEYYLDEVFAESFDSFYCSDKTQKSMKENFLNTYNAFLKVDYRLKAPMHSISSEAKGAESLALQGGQSYWDSQNGFGEGTFGNLFQNIGGDLFANSSFSNGQFNNFSSFGDNGFGSFGDNGFGSFGDNGFGSFGDNGFGSFGGGSFSSCQDSFGFENSLFNGDQSGFQSFPEFSNFDQSFGFGSTDGGLFNNSGLSTSNQSVSCSYNVNGTLRQGSTTEECNRLATESGF